MLFRSLLFATLTSTARAQMPVGSLSELTPLLKPGAVVTVVDVSGRQLTGKVLDLSPSTLKVLVAETEHVLNEADVRTILYRRRDSLKNGAQWGGLIGAGFGAMAYALASSAQYYDGELGSPLLIPAMMAGMGVGVGVAIDAVIVRRQIVLTKPATASTSITLFHIFPHRGLGVLVSTHY